jgi:hypothetical protein
LNWWRKEVKQDMKRIIKVLVVSALMVVLMAITASYAFSSHEECNNKAWWRNEPGEHGCQQWGNAFGKG